MYKHMIEKYLIKCRTPNKHIGKMAALLPLEKVCGIASLPPAGKYSVAATSPICWTLRAMAESVSG